MDLLRIWLDDKRPAPYGWHWVRTPQEVLAWVDAGMVCEISFDHDLGDDVGTGYDAAVGLENRWADCLRGGTPSRPPRDPQFLQQIHQLSCHSANPVGRKRIEAVIESIGRFRKSMERVAQVTSSIEAVSAAVQKSKT